MSQHPSLRSSGKDKAHRSVLKRYERVKLLKEKEKWTDDESVYGLPKVKIVKFKIKKEKAQAVEPAEGALAPAPGAAPSAGAAPAKTADDPVRIGAKPSSTPPEKAPTPATPASTATPAAPAAAPAAPPAPEVTGPFKVTFTAADAGMSLEVKCMQGAGTGPSVTIDEAVKGNCRVVGKSDAATVMTLVTLAGPRTYSCFAGGSRSCR